MLVFDEGNRISWPEIFEHRLIKIAENKTI